MPASLLCSWPTCQSLIIKNWDSSPLHVKLLRVSTDTSGKPELNHQQQHIKRAEIAWGAGTRGCLLYMRSWSCIFRTIKSICKTLLVWQVGHIFTNINKTLSNTKINWNLFDMLAHSDSWHDRKHKRCGKPSFWSCQAQHSLFIIETPHFPPTKNAYIKGLFACIVDEYGDRIFVMRLLVCFRPDRESWSLGKQPTFFQSSPIGIKQEEQVIRNFIMSRSAQWKSLLFGYLHCHLHWHISTESLLPL